MNPFKECHVAAVSRNPPVEFVLENTNSAGALQPETEVSLVDTPMPVRNLVKAAGLIRSCLERVYHDRRVGLNDYIEVMLGCKLQ
jgi:hypothetical protein